MVQRTLVFVFLALWSSATLAAEPLSLLLMHLFWDRATQAGMDAISRQSARPALAPHAPSTPAKLTEEERLQAVIDENFGYLTTAQRKEIHGSLMRVLSDPEHTTLRPAIIEEFTNRAMLVGQANRILGNLSDEEKRAVAAHAVAEYRRLPADEQRQVVDQLRTGIGYIPRDINEMLLTEFSRLGR